MYLQENSLCVICRVNPLTLNTNLTLMEILTDSGGQRERVFFFRCVIPTGYKWIFFCKRSTSLLFHHKLQSQSSVWFMIIGPDYWMRWEWNQDKDRWLHLPLVTDDWTERHTLVKFHRINLHLPWKLSFITGTGQNHKNDCFMISPMKNNTFVFQVKGGLL